jgi:hypothetical protein
MMRIASSIVLCAAALLAACGEKPQTATPAAKKSDAGAWQGSDARYSANGWKAGDRASWEEQMRARARGQNEYSRVATK